MLIKISEVFDESIDMILFGELTEQVATLAKVNSQTNTPRYRDFIDRCEQAITAYPIEVKEVLNDEDDKGTNIQVIRDVRKSLSLSVKEVRERLCKTAKEILGEDCKKYKSYKTIYKKETTDSSFFRYIVCLSFL